MIFLDRFSKPNVANRAAPNGSFAQLFSQNILMLQGEAEQGIGTV